MFFKSIKKKLFTSYALLNLKIKNYVKSNLLLN